MIYADVIDTIKTKALSIPEIAETFMHPLGAEVVDFTTMKRTGTRVKKYPALIFAPATFDNVFASTDTNHRTMRFNAWLVINLENVENIDVYERIMPDAVDAVIGAFDTGWDFGTIDGHRVWARMASGMFGITPNAQGREAWCEMQLIIRLDTNN